MANRTTTKLSEEIGLGRVHCAFQFKISNPNTNDVVLSTVVGVTAGAVSGSNEPPFIASIKHTATGVLTVTLNDSFNKLMWVSADVQDLDPGANGNWATVSAVSNEATSSGITFKINFWHNAAGVNTLTDPTAGQVVMVNCIFRNTVAGN